MVTVLVVNKKSFLRNDRWNDRAQSVATIKFTVDVKVNRRERILPRFHASLEVCYTPADCLRFTSCFGYGIKTQRLPTVVSQHALHMAANVDLAPVFHASFELEHDHVYDTPIYPIYSFDPKETVIPPTSNEIYPPRPQVGAASNPAPPTGPPPKPLASGWCSP